MSWMYPGTEESSQFDGIPFSLLETLEGSMPYDFSTQAEW